MMEASLQDHSTLVLDYLDQCKFPVLDCMKSLLPDDPKFNPILYERMLEYPIRKGKSLRPALCIASARTFGSSIESCLPSASILEFFHNAFLVHDDIEDESEFRRGKHTLHQMFGVPIAINIGDAMLAMALEPLIENMKWVGLGNALHIFKMIAKMCRESVEGQALELEWIRNKSWNLNDQDYFEMVEKKTSWYTFVAPLLIGARIGNTTENRIEKIQNFGKSIGLSFQIHDDILNLKGNENTEYGKEHCGDLWEGKRTLILVHHLNHSNQSDRSRALEILNQPRSIKKAEDIAWLRSSIENTKSIEFAETKAEYWSNRARSDFKEAFESTSHSKHKLFIEGLIDFVRTRGR